MHEPGEHAGGEARVSMDITAEVRQRFGSRYAGIWYGGSTRFVAVVDRTAADQDAAAEIPHIGADIEVVSAQFSEAALTEFRDAVVQIMADGRQLAAGEPRVFGVGFGVHNNDFSSAGQPVVSVLVSDHDPDLLSRIRTLVPDDALEVRVIQPPRRTR